MVTWVIALSGTLNSSRLAKASYGESCHLFNPCDHRDIHPQGAGGLQRPRAALGGGPGGEHVVDQEDALAGDLGGAAGGDLEGAGDVALAPRARLAALGLGGPAARQGVGQV